jgi:hypothetical protein
VISALVRAWRLTGDKRFLELACDGTKAYAIPVQQGGIQDSVAGHIIYVETPGHALPGILDGFLTGLLGLYDVYQDTKDAEILDLWNRGLDGLKFCLPAWDYQHKWSWYSNHAYLCPPQYHVLNLLLLRSIGRLTEDSAIEEYSLAWDPEGLGTTSKAEVFLRFVLTKNLSRVKGRTWGWTTQRISRELGASKRFPEPAETRYAAETHFTDI